MTLATAPITGNPRPPLSQLRPFDESRLRDCIAYISTVNRRSLTQLYVVKLSVLVDVFHLLRCGKPMIGGSIAPWLLGPVVEEAYRACGAWKTDFDHFGKEPPGLHITGRVGAKMAVRGKTKSDLDDFSKFEIDAMHQAWTEIGHLNFAGLKHYTHSPDTFLGAAYSAAKSAGRMMDWDEIVGFYDQFRGEDHSAMRQLIRL